MDTAGATGVLENGELVKTLNAARVSASSSPGGRIEVGASDDIPKPVDTERLLSLLRAWLYYWK